MNRQKEIVFIFGNDKSPLPWELQYMVLEYSGICGTSPKGYFFYIYSPPINLRWLKKNRSTKKNG